MTLKNLPQPLIDWVSRRYDWITISAGVVVVALETWSQIPKITILGYRPDDLTFFFGIIITAIPIMLTGVVQRLEINNIKKKHQKEVNFFKDALIQERTDVLNEHLREIAEKLKFKMQERICVYRFLEHENNFECIGRYSEHPDYGQASIRKRYPLTMGIIGHVWNDGKFDGFIRDKTIPNKEVNEKEYFRYLRERYDIPQNIARRFRMNPVDIIAQVIRDTKKTPIAIIIFESQRSNFIDEKKIKQGYNQFKKMAIVNLLDKLKTQNSPNIKIAKEADL